MKSQPEIADFPCRLCGGTQMRFYFAQGNQGQARYYKCPDCKLVNLDLRGGLDQEQYNTVFEDPTDDTLKFNLSKDQSLAFVSRWVSPPGSFLDIGCGMGRLMYVARRAGWQVKGLELSEHMARQVSQKLGVEVVVGDFLDGNPFHGEQFDLVALRHVIEHLPDSLEAIRRISELTKPGGYLLLEMPNIEAWDKRFKRALERLGLHKRKYADNFVAGHCNEFCKQSMGRLMADSGFEMLRWETYSMKPLSNYIYNRLHVGNKARMLARKKPS